MPSFLTSLYLFICTCLFTQSSTHSPNHSAHIIAQPSTLSSIHPSTQWYYITAQPPTHLSINTLIHCTFIYWTTCSTFCLSHIHPSIHQPTQSPFHVIAQFSFHMSIHWATDPPNFCSSHLTAQQSIYLPTYVYLTFHFTHPYDPSIYGLFIMRGAQNSGRPWSLALRQGFPREKRSKEWGHSSQETVRKMKVEPGSMEGHGKAMRLRMPRSKVWGADREWKSEFCSESTVLVGRRAEKRHWW